MRDFLPHGAGTGVAGHYRKRAPFVFPLESRLGK